MVLEVVMDLLQPTLMAHIVDAGIARSDIRVLTVTGAFMVGAALLGLLGGALCSLWAARASVAMGADLREHVFGHVLTLSAADRDRLTPASLITRCTNDIMQVQTMLLMMLRGMVRIPLLLLGSLVMAVLLSPSLSLVFLVVLPLVVVSIAVVLVRSSSLFSGVQEALDRVNTLAREGLLGMRITKAFGLETAQQHRFNVQNEQLGTSSIRAQAVNYSLLPVVTLIMNLCVVAVLWFGGHQVVTGDLAIGKIMAFINYLVQVSGSVMMGVGLITNLSRAQVSARRLNEILSTAPSVVPPKVPGRSADNSVEFRRVTFTYPGSSAPALQDLSFRLEAGKHLGIIGSTGAGKSTLASLVPRLYDPQEGEVLVGGRNVRDWTPAELHRKIGLATQQSVLFSGTVETNLRFGRSEAGGEDLESALKTAQALDFVRALPGGTEAHVEARGKNFSGGQRQRLALARVLATRTPIVILDDVSSALDLGTEAELNRALASLGPKLTRITVAQRVASLVRCDRILVLDQGKQAAWGSHAELLTTSPLYRSIVVSQWGEEAEGV